MIKKSIYINDYEEFLCLFLLVCFTNISLCKKCIVFKDLHRFLYCEVVQQVEIFNNSLPLLKKKKKKNFVLFQNFKAEYSLEY